MKIPTFVAEKADQKNKTRNDNHTNNTSDDQGKSVVEGTRNSVTGPQSLVRKQLIIPTAQDTTCSLESRSSLAALPIFARNQNVTKNNVVSRGFSMESCGNISLGCGDYGRVPRINPTTLSIKPTSSPSTAIATKAAATRRSTTTNFAGGVAPAPYENLE